MISNSNAGTIQESFNQNQLQITGVATPGKILQFNVDGIPSAGTVQLTPPSASGTLLTNNSTQVTATDLKSATTTVNVSAATAPSPNQVLTATDSTHATWVTPTSGSNPPFNDNVSLIQNSSTTSKQLIIGVSNLSGTETANMPTFTNGDTFTLNAATETLTNKTLTTPVIASIVNTGTLTLPTSTDTLVGRATTDTLTNKTLTGTTNVVRASQLGTSGSDVVITGTAPTATGQVLASLAGNTTASWQTLSGGSGVVNTLVTQITTLGVSTFNVNTKTLFAFVEVWGAGGGGGGVNGAVSNYGAAPGGGAGGYSADFFTKSAMGTSFSVTVGTKGLGGAAGSNTGTNGGSSSALTLTSGGGVGGNGAAAHTVSFSNSGPIGGTASGTFGLIGGSGCCSLESTLGQFAQGGAGGDAYGFPGGFTIISSPSIPQHDGVAPNRYTFGGGGGGGGSTASTSTSSAGGNGAHGLFQITEYLSA